MEQLLPIAIVMAPTLAVAATIQAWRDHRQMCRRNEQLAKGPRGGTRQPGGANPGPPWDDAHKHIRRR